MNFRLSYYNTAASRCILDILRTLRNQYDTGKKITINWYYPDPDYDEMKAEAEDYMEEIGLPINLISYKQT
jgi:membrane-bound lytic murein transglycosylase MltF